MAQNLIWKIICNDSTPTAYTAGDVIDVYYNDTTEVIEVEVNGTPETAGEDIYQEYCYFPNGEPQGFPDQGSAFECRYQSYEFCDSSNLVFFPFGETFPYSFRAQDFNEACNANVCDLLPGLSTITPATGIGTADGSITVIATSSYTIKYFIGDFDYNTQGQSSGTFTGLYPGTYSIYAKDSNGCQYIFQDLVVGFDNTSTYGVLQYWEYYDKLGTQHKVELLQRDYSGSSTLRDLLDGTPTLRRVRGENNTRLDVIFPGELDVFVKSETDKEYLELVKDADDTKFLIKHFYNPGGGGYQLIFQGYVTVSQYSEPYEPGVYTSVLHSTDRMADLKTIDFTDDSGNHVYGDLKVLDVIRLCLNKTRLDFGYRIAMNLYEANHDSTAADDPLNQTYVDSDSYYNENEPEDCYTVLEKVLKSINCKVISYGGYWYIIYKPEENTTYAYREFNSSGVYQSNSTINPVVSFKQSTGSDRVTWLTGSNNLQLEPVYKKITITSNRNLKNSIVRPFSERTLNGTNFTGWSKVLDGDSGTFTPVINPEFQVIVGGDPNLVIGTPTSFTRDVYYFQSLFQDGQGGNAYIAASGPIEYKGLDEFSIKIPLIFYNNYGSLGTPAYVKVKFLLKVGSKYYNYGDTWSGSAVVNEYAFSDYNQDGEVELRGRFDSSVTTNTTTTFELRIYDVDLFESDVTGSTVSNLYSNVGALSTTGDLGTRLVGRVSGASETLVYYELRLNDSGNNEWQRVATYSTSDLTFGTSTVLFRSIEFLTYPGGQQIDATESLTIKTQRENVINLGYDVDHFDLNTSINNTEQLITNYFRLSDGTPTSAWGTNQKKIQRIIGESISKWYNTAGYRIRGRVTTDRHLIPYNVFKETSDDNRVYTPVSLEIDDKHMTANVELVELQSDTTVTPSGFTSGFEQDAYL